MSEKIDEHQLPCGKQQTGAPSSKTSASALLPNDEKPTFVYCLGKHESEKPQKVTTTEKRKNVLARC